MVRKPNRIEGASSGFPDASEEPSAIRPSRSQLLQQRIAEQLGLSPEAFSTAPVPASGAPNGCPPSGAFEIGLSHECLELLEAYSRIKDPEQRRRCLQAVREAADGSAVAGPVTES
ncbi:hypothetical protein [Methylobacterium sp. 37f]|uniref:hypothetical protein n=1 Tax=Methylobacterium sp. 37f TaxID=2817058 RepID=UPI001FFDD452|nr:hypothetical protein [Methylobacterium sp. 37f]MCK2056412.1 hypothetical protein [Methylobacterium sp. 37f]